MIEQLHAIIADTIKSNQFLSGGLVLGLLGGVTVYFRRLPSQIYDLLRRKLIVDIEIRNTESCYAWLIRWFHYQKFINRSNKLILSTWEDYSDDNINESNRHKFCLSPGIGLHWFRYNGKFFWIHRERRDGGANSEGMFRDIETINISTFRWNKHVVFDMVEDSKLIYFGDKKNGIPLYMPEYRSWLHYDMLCKRPIASVVLNNGIMMNIIDDLQTFFDSKEKYEELGIPYHRGYMFSGPPGNGKTATIIALAGHFNRPIYYMNLSSLTSDDNLQDLFGRLPKNCFLVIEDIDTSSAAYRPSGDNTDKSSFKVTFGHLLNILDGICSKEGLCVFVTTNHPENLDDALIRKGRIDRHIEFGYADADMTKRMIRKFMPDAKICDIDYIAEEVDRAGDISMASIQEALNGATTLTHICNELGLSTKHKKEMIS